LTRVRELDVRREPAQAIAYQALLTAEAPPPRVLVDLVALMPGDVRLDAVSMSYGEPLGLKVDVVARTASSYDLFLDRLQRSPLFAGVRLGVRPGRPPASAAVALSAEGSFADVMSLARELSRAGRGLVLGRVRLEARSSRVGLDLEASGLGSVPPGFRSRGVNPRSLFEAGGPSGSPAPPAADPDLPWPARD